MSHEGGYNPIYVPFCGLAVLEAMAGVHVLDDPILPVVAGMTGHELKPAEAEVIAAAATRIPTPAALVAPGWPRISILGACTCLPRPTARSPATTPPAPIPPCSRPSPAANDGHALAYGDDRWTARVRGRVPGAVRPTSRRC